MRAIIALALGLAALAWLAGMLAKPVNAQAVQCLPVDQALGALALQYQEAPRVTALTSSGSLMIVTSNADGGWSVLLVAPDQTACMVASGSALEVMPPDVPGVDG